MTRRRRARTADAWADPAARLYLVAGLTAAAVLSLALLERGAGLWAVLPPLIAAAGLAFRWSTGPVFVLLGVAIALLVSQPFQSQVTPTADFLLAGAVLTYVLAQFRICANCGAVFPPDPRPVLSGSGSTGRRLPGWAEFLLALTVVPYLVYLARRPRRQQPLRSPAEQRDGATAGPNELARALVGVGLAAAAALVVWHATNNPRPPLFANARQWHLGVVGWCVAGAAFVTWVIAGYVAARGMAVEKARLVLHEALWKETRREQRRVGRWTAWARKAASGEGT